MPRLPVLLLLAALISAPVLAKPSHADFVAKAKKVMAAELKDPDSAKFRHLAVYEPATGVGFALCGEVNAKNAYGGYVGFKKFFAIEEMAEVESQDGSGLYGALSASLCHKKLANVS